MRSGRQGYRTLIPSLSTLTYPSLTMLSNMSLLRKHHHPSRTRAHWDYDKINEPPWIKWASSLNSSNHVCAPPHRPSTTGRPFLPLHSPKKNFWEFIATRSRNLACFSSPFLGGYADRPNVPAFSVSIISTLPAAFRSLIFNP
mmetsp:Transcript_45142/g.54284  ORF Transcript_45142/g.54284 Transcript_45142/m.54284 type:complete len:143 (-) Transcript_45142:143-571(-)